MSEARSYRPDSDRLLDDQMQLLNDAVKIKPHPSDKGLQRMCDSMKVEHIAFNC